VARGGDADWTNAADVATAHPELAEVAEAAAPEAQETAAPAGAGWSAVEESEPAEQDVPWATPEPSAAATEVLGDAAVERDTGRPAATPGAQQPVSAGGMVPQEGLGAWIGQAWQMVTGDIWVWIGAMLLMILVGAATLGIAVPALFVGLYIMALRSFDGREIAAGDLFEGFRRFWSAWGVTLMAMVPAAVLIAPRMILLAVPMLAGVDEDVAGSVNFGFDLLWPVLYLVWLAIGTILFYSWVLVADGCTAWEAVVRSSEKVRVSFWSYLGMFLLLTIIGRLGVLACYVGWLVTYPLLPCAVVAAYRWHFRDVADAAAG